MYRDKVSRPRTLASRLARGRRAAAVALGSLVLAAPSAAPQPVGSSLPDWSGIWAMVGPTVFDRATVQPSDGRAGTAGVREFPPYNERWEAKYRANIERVAADRFPDPVSICGVPHGFPRLMNLPDVYEFVVRPEQTWIITENGPNVLRIYTDGRDHPAPADLWPTFSGDSVGHWEGDTLVVDTIGIKGEDGTIIDRTGLVLSTAAHIVMRLRAVDTDLLEASFAIDDPEALTATWRVTKQYRRLPAGTRAYDYACAENNRNSISASGRTLTLDSQGQVIDRVEE
jgi:hypothetical protein